jgi:NAD dependent epimerase/dehydratase family enzyme
MQNKTIVIAGGTGFIGNELVKYFGRDNKIIILTRQMPNQKNNRNNFDSLRLEDLKKCNIHSMGCQNLWCMDAVA